MTVQELLENNRFCAINGISDLLSVFQFGSNCNMLKRTRMKEGFIKDNTLYIDGNVSKFKVFTKEVESAVKDVSYYKSINSRRIHEKYNPKKHAKVSFSIEG